MKIKTKQSVAQALYVLLGIILAVPIIMAGGWYGVILLVVVTGGLMLFLHWIEPRKF